GSPAGTRHGLPPPEDTVVLGDPGARSSERDRGQAPVVSSGSCRRRAVRSVDDVVPPRPRPRDGVPRAVRRVRTRSVAVLRRLPVGAGVARAPVVPPLRPALAPAGRAMSRLPAGGDRLRARPVPVRRAGPSRDPEAEVLRLANR